jgi:phosphoglycolate phosphatase-like HAD superfamily hydrolase
MSKNIVLDCDGVILDYVSMYGKILELTFNQKFSPKNIAYHAHNVFDFNIPSHLKKQFFDNFHQLGWSNMSPLHGAIEAIQIISSKKFNIHIVTSIPSQAYQLRLNNLLNLKIPISSFHTSSDSSFNPKKNIVNSINPDFFVDDLLQNFHQINSSIHCSLIHIPGNDNPNIQFLQNYNHNYHSKFNSLLEFSKSI